MISHSVDCDFVLLTMSLALQKLFRFMRSHLLVFLVPFGVLFRKLSTVPRLFPTFLLLGSVYLVYVEVHLEERFVLQGDRYDLFVFFHIHTPRINCLKCFHFFSLCVYDFFIKKNQGSIGVSIYLWVFDLILLVNESVFMPIPCGFCYYSSSVQCEVRDDDPFASSIIVQVCFSYSGLFPHEVEYCLFKIFKKLCLNFDADCIESSDSFQ